VRERAEVTAQQHQFRSLIFRSNPRRPRGGSPRAHGFGVRYFRTASSLLMLFNEASAIGSASQTRRMRATSLAT